MFRGCCHLARSLCVCVFVFVSVFVCVGAAVERMDISMHVLVIHSVTGGGDV